MNESHQYHAFTANAEQIEKEQTEYAEQYPGWKPEDGTSDYGYPFLRDVSKLTDTQVRTWGKAAIRLRGEVAAGRAFGQAHPNWVIDVAQWSKSVIDFVVERLGEHDAELTAYVEVAYADASSYETSPPVVTRVPAAWLVSPSRQFPRTSLRGGQVSHRAGSGDWDAGTTAASWRRAGG